jgi:hypothetical protein
MKLIRLIISCPIIFTSSLIAIGGGFWYFFGCFLGLIGGYIFTKAIKHDREGIGWALIGFPIYFFAMLPITNSFLFMIIGDGLTTYMVRLMLSMLGLVLALIPFTIKN